MKRALITGITGQDGSYLAEFLLEKGYEVHGIKRRSSLFNTQRIDHIYQDPHVENSRFKLHYGDLSDTSNLTRILRDIEPDEVYNLGAQSHVAVSFESPEYTADVDGVGTLRMFEAIRFLGLEQNIVNIMAGLKSRDPVEREAASAEAIALGVDPRLVLSAQLLNNSGYRRHSEKLPDLKKLVRLLSVEYREVQKSRPIEVVAVTRY
jgi:uncharacterized protein YbjT (DUF2867 family)